MKDQINYLNQRITTLEEIIAISRTLNSTLEMRPLLQQIVDAAHDLTDADGSSILLLEKDILRFAASYGPQKEVLAITEVPLDNSLAGWVVHNKELAIVEDAQSDPRHYNISNVDATQSIVAVPMLFGDTVIGVLEAITSRARRKFTPENIETLQTLASIAAVAVQNARLFAQSDWIAEIVHEIRTPLTAILSYSDLLVRPNTDTEMHQKFADIIRQEAERVSQLASQFLDLARLESGRVSMACEALNIPTVANLALNVIRPLAEESRKHLKITMPENLPQTRGDSQRIHQVLLNLLSNAVKYSDPGDTITLKSWVEDNEIITSVSDTGPGIAPDQLDKLFKKFSRLASNENKATGTGLGLVITRQIVEAHQGRIWVESELGKGTTFLFALPIME
ncbi:MAG: GAF domain-containing protein [Anaerolineae bacterium]|nr:GAF domain-containing protein [Anaerolineae bacterium]